MPLCPNLMNTLMNLGKFSMRKKMRKGKDVQRSWLKKCIFALLGFVFIVMFVFTQWIDRRTYMIEMKDPIIVAFPLRGEWFSPNTPGTKIPSHGTNQLGTRYAYDFIQVDWERTGYPAYRVSLPQYLLFGVPLNEYYCWGQEVYAPCDGIVVRAEDSYEERTRTNLFSDLTNAYKNAHYFNPEKDDVQLVAGNYIIIECGDSIYAALVHLQTGSIQVSVGQSVKKGDVIGRVGHSGNSFAPHLHFQLMDSCDITTANGLPCAFEQYEIFQDGKWKTVVNGIPTNKDRIRFQKTNSKDMK